MKKWFLVFIFAFVVLVATATQAQKPNQQAVTAAEAHLRHQLPKFEQLVQTQLLDNLDLAHGADLLKEQAVQLADVFRQAHAPYTQNSQTYNDQIAFAAMIAHTGFMAFPLQEAMNAQNRNAGFKPSQLRYLVYDLEILSKRLANAKREKRQQRLLSNINKTLIKLKAQVANA